MKKISLNTSADLKYKIEIIRDGETIASTDWKSHMITDSGLDKVASMSWLHCLNVPILGDSVSPLAVRRDSSPTTFTQVGTTLSASGNFFDASDVGRLFKYGVGDSGVEVYITGYTDAMNVTVGTSLTVTLPTVGTIWYVNTAALISPISGLSWSKVVGAVNNFSSCSVSGSNAVVTHQTTFISSPFGSSKTVSEIAFSDSSTNSNVFDRDIVSPPVAVSSGDQAKIILQLHNKYSPVTPLTVSNFAVGYDSSGSLQIEGLDFVSNDCIARFFDNGTIAPPYGTYTLEPYAGYSIYCFRTARTQNAFDVNGSLLPVGTEPFRDATLSTYGTGTHFVDGNVTFNASSFSGNVYGFALGIPGNAGYGGLSYVLNSLFNKSNVQSLSLTFRKSWSRILTN